REHVDAGPQGGAGEVVAVQGEPDPLEPDDEDEHQPAPAYGGQQRGDAAGGEGPDAEEVEPEHGVGHPRLDEAEGNEQGDPADQAAEDEGAGPAHGVAPIGLDPVGDTDHDRDE